MRSSRRFSREPGVQAGRATSSAPPDREETEDRPTRKPAVRLHPRFALIPLPEAVFRRRASGCRGWSSPRRSVWRSPPRRFAAIEAPRPAAILLVQSSPLDGIDLENGGARCPGGAARRGRGDGAAEVRWLRPPGARACPRPFQAGTSADAISSAMLSKGVGVVLRASRPSTGTIRPSFMARDISA